MDSLSNLPFKSQVMLLQSTKLGPGAYNVETTGSFSAPAVADRASGPGLLPSYPGYFCIHIYLIVVPCFSSTSVAYFWCGVCEFKFLDGLQ